MGKFEEHIKKIFEEHNLNQNLNHWEDLKSKLDSQEAPSSFDEKVQSVFNEASIPFNPVHFDAISDKIKSNPKFDEKAKEILNEGEVDYNAEHWNDLESKLPSELSSFETRAKEILSNGPVIPAMPSFDAFSDKLNDANLSNFEKAAKSTLNNGTAAYNEEHWEDLKRRLDKKKRRPILFWWTAAAAAIFAGGVFLFNANENIIDEANGSANASSNTKTEQDNNTSSKTLKERNNLSLTYTEDNNLDSKENTTAKTDLKNIIEDNLIKEDERNNKALSPSIYSNSSSNNRNNNRRTINSSSPKSKTNSNLLVEQEKSFGEFAFVDALFKNSKINLKELSINKKPYDYEFKKINLAKSNMNPSALLWLNMWDNAAVTGMHGKQHYSFIYKNDWFLGEKDNTNTGEIDMVRPLHFLFAYEHQINNLTIGGYLKHEQRVNWMYNDINLSASYKKEVLPNTFIRIGAAATYHWNKLDLKNLSLKEQVVDAETYNITLESEIERLAPKTFMSYDVAALISNPHFFAGYTLKNFAQTNLNYNDELIKEHDAFAGFHLPLGSKLIASPMFRYNKVLEGKLCPGVGISYDKKLYANAEYNNLNRFDFTIGALLKKKLRIAATFGIKQLEENKKELNLNKFQEREGYILGGIYYTLK